MPQFYKMLIVRLTSGRFKISQQQLAANLKKKNNQKCQQVKKVQELFTLKEEDEINCHITGTINDCYCHVTQFLLLRKRTLTHAQYIILGADVVVIHITPIMPLYVPKRGMLSKITHWGGIMPMLFGSL